MCNGRFVWTLWHKSLKVYGIIQKQISIDEFLSLPISLAPWRLVGQLFLLQTSFLELNPGHAYIYEFWVSKNNRNKMVAELWFIPIYNVDGMRPIKSLKGRPNNKCSILVTCIIRWKGDPMDPMIRSLIWGDIFVRCKLNSKRMKEKFNSLHISLVVYSFPCQLVLN